MPRRRTSKKSAPKRNSKRATKPAAKKQRPSLKTPRRAVVLKAPAMKAARIGEQVNLLQEELQAALGELARIASDENSARRDLEAQVSAARSREDALRRELEAVRMDLRVALADLEITRSRSPA